MGKEEGRERAMRREKEKVRSEVGERSGSEWRDREREEEKEGGMEEDTQATSCISLATACRFQRH